MVPLGHAQPARTGQRRRARHQVSPDGILRRLDSKIANGLIEGINSVVRAPKPRARGYRSLRNLKAMVHLLAGKLDPRLHA